MSPNGQRLCTTAFICALVAGPMTASVALARIAVDADQAGSQMTPAEVAPFMGDWTLELKGPDGPATFGLLVRAEGEKVVGELTSETMPKQVITDVAMSKNALTLSYTFTWESMPVDAVVSLTPGKDGIMHAQIDFAGGAYTLVGIATKKPAGK